MALSTNLARLRARIKKELKTREITPSPAQSAATPVKGPAERPAASPQAAAERGKPGSRPNIGQAASKGVSAGRSFLKLAEDLMSPDTSRSPDESTSDRLRSGIDTPSMPADVQSAFAGLSPGVGGSGVSQGQLPADAFSLANFGPFSSSAQGAETPDLSQIFSEGAATPTSPIQAQQTSAATPTGQAFQGKGGDIASGIGGGLGSLLGALGSFTDNKALSGAGKGLGLATSAFDLFKGGATGAGGANLAGSLLSMLGGESGSKGLSTLDSVISGLPSAALIAGSAIPSLAPMLAGLSANPVTAIIAAAITQIMDMTNSLEQGYSGEHTFLKGLVAPIPIVGQLAGPEIDKAFLPSEAYTNFPNKVMKNAGQQGDMFESIQQGLPYVKSKEELGQLLNSAKNFLTTTTGSDYDFGTGPYQVSSFPGVGARTHGMPTNPINWGPQTQNLQRQVDALLGVLPGNQITQGYGQPGGGLEGEPLARLWTQFNLKDAGWGAHDIPGMDLPHDQPMVQGPGSWVSSSNESDGPQWSQGMVPAPQDGIDRRQANFTGTFEGESSPTSWSGLYRDLVTGWNTDTGQMGVRRPGSAPYKTPAEAYQISPAWQSLTTPRPASAASVAGPAVAVPGGIDPKGSSGFASLKGPTSELLTAEDPNRL